MLEADGDESPEIRSFDDASQASRVSGTIVRSWPVWYSVAATAGGARRGMPEAAVTQNYFDHRPLRRFDEDDHLYLAAALGTGQGGDLVQPLDEHGPGLATAVGDGNRRGIAAGRCAPALP